MLRWIQKSLGVGKYAPKAPDAPDAAATAKAQTEANERAAFYNAYGSTGTTSGPVGTSTRNVEIKTVERINPTTGEKEKISVPVQSVTHSLDPAGQGVFNQATGLSTDALEQLRGDITGAGIAENIEGRLTELGSRRLNPMLDEQRRLAEERGAQRGITTGSGIADRNALRQAQAENDARTALITGAYGTAANIAAQDRASLMNAAGTGVNIRGGLNAALQGQSGPAQSTINPTNVADITNQNYANQVAAYQAEASKPNFWSALGQAGGIAAKAYLGA